ncbi:hypothetical protein GOB57_24985 [Sinorhizobium meliloti]|nr:hypothetical protein [Sinorhizobium meliloti]
MQTYDVLTAIAAMELFRTLRDHPIISNERASRSTKRRVAAEELRLVAERESDVLLAMAAGMSPLTPEREIKERLGL